MSASQVAAVLVAASAGVIFWYRVKALWIDTSYVNVIVGIFYFTMIGSWVRVPIHILQ